ncbi:MAG: heavy metal translocating P-type ATPase metal-binding domain-containing protein [Anaerolineae bacterium]
MTHLTASLPSGAAAATSPAPTSRALCLHCGSPVPSGRSDGYCCAGCMAVQRLLGEAGLDGYYALRPARIGPARLLRAPRLVDWLAGTTPARRRVASIWPSRAFSARRASGRSRSWRGATGWRASASTPPSAG